MNDSVLQDVLSTIYAENAVSHILSGKACSRALRGYRLIHMTIQWLFVSDVFNLEISKDTQEDDKKMQSNDQASETIEMYLEETDGAENKIDTDLECALKLFDWLVI